MRKVVFGIIGAVTLLLAGMLAWDAEAQPSTVVCHIGGRWICFLHPWACSCSHCYPMANCCKLYGKWHCPCLPPPQ